MEKVVLPETTIAYYLWKEIKCLVDSDISVKDFTIELNRVKLSMLESNLNGRFSEDYGYLMGGTDEVKS